VAIPESKEPSPFSSLRSGEEYEPTTLRSFVSSFDRYLRKKGYSTAIIERQEFRKTRERPVAKQKELKKTGKGNKTKVARALTDEEVDVLYRKRNFGSFVSGVLVKHVVVE